MDRPTTFALLGAIFLAPMPAPAQTASVYAMAGAASAHFDRCGAPELGDRIRKALDALADECNAPDALRAEYRALLGPILDAAREAANTPEGAACRALLHIDPSMPAFRARLEKFEAGQMTPSQALPLACDRLSAVPQ